MQTSSPARPSDAFATVVVVPREGFRIAAANLARLLDVTAAPFGLVYVDAGSPRRVAAELKALVASHGGALLRVDRFLRPTTARNLGMAHVATPYTVFLDNDVWVSHGWLDALVGCARETGAAFVSPIVCMGGEASRVVHFAGGHNRIEDVAGQRRLRESYDDAGRPLSELPGRLARRRTELAEFHAVLTRTHSLRSIGGLDERCPSAFEHNDMCLTFAELGGEGWLEPNAVVEYVLDRPTAWSNAPYHALRWSRSWIQQSLAGFCDKWMLEPGDPALVADLRSLHERRRRPFRYARGLARRVAGPRGVATLDRVADAVLDRLVGRLDRRPPAIETTRWPAR